MARKVILDVDTGSDDAVAIILAALHPDIDLVAVCTVKGNQPLVNTTENTRKVLDLVKSDVPLYKGCKENFVRDKCPWRIKFEDRATIVDDKGMEHFIHEDLDMLPTSNRKVEEVPAPVFYVDYLNKTEQPVTLVCVGPLTNLATALSIDPSIVRNVEELVIMGGADDEANATSSAEFNIFGDPESAQKVFQAGFKRIVMMPLDVTHKTMVTKADCERFRQINTFSANFCAGQCEQRIIMHDAGQPLEIPHSAAVHDALAVSYVIDPTVLTDLRHVHVDIGLKGYGSGQTIVDMRAYPLELNSWFAFDGDRFKFVDILCDCFKRDKSTARVLSDDEVEE